MRDFTAKLPALRNCFSRLRGRIFIPALSGLQGEIQGRIHNDGKDSKGRFLNAGTNFKKPRKEDYSVGHARKRRVNKRKIGKKDFELFGDLRRSYTVGLENGSPALGFNNDLERIKAEKLESQHKKEVWKMTTGERKRFYKEVARLARKEIIKCLK